VINVRIDTEFPVGFVGSFDADVIAADQQLEGRGPSFVHKGKTGFVDPHIEREPAMRYFMFGYKPGKEDILIGIIVDHHGIFHIGESLEDRGLDKGVRYARPLMRKPAYGMT